ncbi:hypothetical protein [Streptacidiphilus sp. EB103A]
MNVIVKTTVNVIVMSVKTTVMVIVLTTQKATSLMRVVAFCVVSIF